MNTPQNETLSSRPIDHVTAVVRGVVGAVPIVGPMLTEVVGTLVPNQRVDRIADYAQKLHDRIDQLEDERLQPYLQDANFVDLLEESLQQAARSTSEERREYIASVVASAINDEQVAAIEKQHLLKILGRLNDIEVIWLIAYNQGVFLGQRSDFQTRHQNVLHPVSAHMQSSRQELDQSALQDSYKLHLEREGLLKRNDRGSYEIAPLGRLLVRHIGMANIG